MTEQLARVWLRPFPGLLTAAPHLPESLSCLVWLAVECLPLLVWPRWRDLGSWRLCWSWMVLVPLPVVFVNLSRFDGWLAGHPWVGTLDVICNA